MSKLFMFLSLIALLAMSGCASHQQATNSSFQVDKDKIKAVEDAKWRSHSRVTVIWVNPPRKKHN
ncbi:hypothetical protein [Pleionea sp. CnH1-48]|uniref:hypothetical protein n=1 Tax=Pleionea sp. CnH1-48 TaxID=2954494 RepID=UPI0020969B78|nr:hypothetical protein [Pleionea sp. CnH1-48]MCO7224625.1 hypothetical protein [Pleionea sp. CnH1-48]